MSAATVVGAVWQSAAVTGDIDANTATVRAAIERAAAEGAHIIVFPELFLTNYNDGSSASEVQGSALSLDGEVMASIAAMAGVHSIAVAVGYAEKVERGADECEVRVYNSCALWDCHGHLVKNYRKVNLWGAWENVVFARGAPCDFETVALELRGGRKLTVGVLICFDVEFPEPARCLALAGATLLIVPTALGGGGSAADVIPLCCVPTRAMENHVAILYSNLEGPFVPSGPFCGRSAIVNPDGSVVARAATLSDGGVGELIVGELELDGAKVDAWLKRNPYLATVKARLSEGFYDQLRVAK